LKKISVFILFFSSIITIAQERTIEDIKTIELKNSIRLNHIFIDQPDITYTYGDGTQYELFPKMGFLGLNYNIPLTNWLYTGAGFHAASFGDQGGLFTLGVNLGINLPIYKNLFFDANLHFGGGGGFRSLVNGGALLYPNAGFQYKLKDVSFGIQYGIVDFFDGIQGGNNISFFVEIPTSVKAGSYKNAHKTYKVVETDDDFWEKPAVKSVQQVKFDFFFPRGRTRNDGVGNFNNTTPITQTLYIIGFEYHRYINHNTFLYAHLDTMYRGLRAGFMDMFFGIGKNFIETRHINFFAKMGLGSAGGRIFPENGLTMYPSAGFDVRFSDHFGLSVHGGYHRAVAATFEAITTGVSLKYYGLSGGSKDPFTKEKAKYIKTQGVQIGLQNQTYFDVAILNKPKRDLQQIALKINYDITPYIYVAGEASFAYLGGAGGYAHGLFGLGVKSNRFFNEKISLFAEAAGGVAGGGGVDSGEGVLVRPTAGINYHISNDFHLNTSIGQMVSPFGNVNSTNVNIGFTYSLSVLNAKKK
jgi:hypothetical protein